MFLRKIIPGSIEKSYGIEVAEMAGMPSEVVTKSKLYLETNKPERSQRSLFDLSAHQEPIEKIVKVETDKYDTVVQEVLGMDTNQMTPMESLIKLSEIRDKIKKIS